MDSLKGVWLGLQSGWLLVARSSGASRQSISKWPSERFLGAPLPRRQAHLTEREREREEVGAGSAQGSS